MTRAINNAMKKMTTEQFIQRAQETHGSYYDYSCTEYVSFRTPIVIVCPIHGDFEQLPSNHLKGSGCKHCSYQNKTSKIDDFIAKSHTIHHNKYDYSQVSLSRMNDKITIICPIHGEFEQRAASHLDGRGCFKCSGKHKSNTEDFIKKSCKKHGDKYDYSYVDYTNSKTGVIITCPQHGNFEQTPSDHLHGYGCPACAGNISMSKDLFVEKAFETHGRYYDYTKLSMEGMNKHGLITCPIHGEFRQRLADHLNGVGCPICGKAKQGGYCENFFENNPEAKTKQAKIYLISSGDRFCKIGITTKPYVKQRFSGFLYVVESEKNLSLYEAYKREQEILDKFKISRFKIKDFKQMMWQSGWTECFPLELLDDLKDEFEKVTYNG